MSDTATHYKPAPVVSIVIPYWNTCELTRICPEFLDRAEKPATEVMIVENGSEEGSLEMIREGWQQYRLVVNEESQGFAKGSNQGLKLARGSFVLLLNTDTERVTRGAREQPAVRADPLDLSNLMTGQNDQGVEE